MTIDSRPPTSTLAPAGGRGGAGAPPTPPKLEKENLATLVARVDAFVSANIPERNKLKIDPVLGIDPALADKIKKTADSRAEAIQNMYRTSQEQLTDFLLEDLIVFGGCYDEKNPSDNFRWFGVEGDAFETDPLHDLGGYGSDGLAVLPAREKEKVPSPLIFRFDATTSAVREGSEDAGFGTLKKVWRTMYDIVTTGGFGNVPFISVKQRGAPEAQAAGLVNAPRIILAASRDQTLAFAREVLELENVINKKKTEDAAEEYLYLDPNTRDDADMRSRKRREDIEKAENKIRTHELQLQFAVQMVAQFSFYRAFAATHLRRVNRAIYKIESGGQEIPETQGAALTQKIADDEWGMCGQTLPPTLGELKALQAALADTIGRLAIYERASQATYDELVLKLYTYEQEEGVPVQQRRKRFARDIMLSNIVLDDPAHRTLMGFVTDPALRIEISKLGYAALGFASAPKTRMS